MRAILKILIAAGIAASFSFNVQAADTAPADTAAPPSVQDHLQRMERMKDMTPEQLAKHRAEKHKEWESMTPEQRAERRKERHKRFEKMPPEERKAMREKMRERLRNMPPEEREARRREMHERFEKMSPEEREQFRRDMGRHGDMPGGRAEGSTASGLFNVWAMWHSFRKCMAAEIAANLRRHV